MRSLSYLLCAFGALAGALPAVQAGPAPLVTSVISTGLSTYYFARRSKPTFANGGDVVAALAAELADPTSQDEHFQHVYGSDPTQEEYCTVTDIPSLALFSARGVNSPNGDGVCPNLGSDDDLLMHVTIKVSTNQASQLAVRAGMDFGYGGVILIDGNQYAFSNIDLWWNYNFNDAAAFLGTPYVNVGAGVHTIEIIGAEDNSDGPSTIQISWNQLPYVPVQNTPGANGDPQFTGFMGQSFQVHGVSDAVYNIISTPSFQYNALFSYLNQGQARKGTLAFSHPGNYFGAVGVSIKDQAGSVNGLVITAGPVDQGLQLKLNNETVAVSSVLTLGQYTVSLPSAFEVLFDSDEFNIRVQNSDMFLNQDVSISTKLMQQISAYKAAAKTDASSAAELKARLPHGILGQTWNTAKHNNRWEFIEGQLFDYQVADGVLGHQFRYTRF